MRKSEESGMTSNFLTLATRMEATVEVSEYRSKKGSEGGK